MWLPLRESALTPLSPVTEMLCVMLGLWVPCLLAYCVMRHMGRRAILAGSAVVIGIGVSALSAALSWGAAHAWGWGGLPVGMGVWGGLGLAMGGMPLPRRACAGLLLLVLVLQLRSG